MYVWGRVLLVYRGLLPSLALISVHSLGYWLVVTKAEIVVDQFLNISLFILLWSSLGRIIQIFSDLLEGQVRIFFLAWPFNI